MVFESSKGVKAAIAEGGVDVGETAAEDITLQERVLHRKKGKGADGRALKAK